MQGSCVPPFQKKQDMPATGNTRKAGMWGPHSHPSHTAAHKLAFKIDQEQNQCTGLGVGGGGGQGAGEVGEAGEEEGGKKKKNTPPQAPVPVGLLPRSLTRGRGHCSQPLPRSHQHPSQRMMGARGTSRGRRWPDHAPVATMAHRTRARANIFPKIYSVLFVSWLDSFLSLR